VRILPGRFTWGVLLKSRGRLPAGRVLFFPKNKGTVLLREPSPGFYYLFLLKLSLTVLAVRITIKPVVDLARNPAPISQ